MVIIKIRLEKMMFLFQNYFTENLDVKFFTFNENKRPKRMD